MALSIKNATAERLAKELARRRKTTVTKAVILALEEQLKRDVGRREAPSLLDAVARIARRVAELPDRDTRPADEVLYDEHGLPR